MARSHTPRRESTALDTITNLFAIGLVLIVGWLAWPYLIAQFQARIASAPGVTLPTASIPRATPLSPPNTGAGQPGADSPAVPTQSLAQVEATSLAIYHATAVAAGAPNPNVNTTNDTQPIVLEQKAVEVRPASAGIVPTSEPIPPTPEGGSAIGDKVAPPINIQQTHTCLHAQIWTDSGCHNPTPVN